MQTTTSEIIAAQLGNDGQRWATDAGRHLSGLCETAGGRRTAGEGIRFSGAVRWAFADGSALTALPGGWDLGYPACFCWASVGHTCAQAGDSECCSLHRHGE